MRKTGFSLVELIVVMAIIALMMAVAVPMFSRFGGTTNLRTSAREISAALNAARGYALTKRRSHSIEFSNINSTSANTELRIMDGLTQIDKKISLQPTIIIDQIMIGGSPNIPSTVDIVFKSTGSADASYNIYLRKRSLSDPDPSDYFTVNVEAITGRVSITESK